VEMNCLPIFYEISTSANEERCRDSCVYKFSIPYNNLGVIKNNMMHKEACMYDLSGETLVEAL
jgi:hypothetical protein